MPPRSPLPARAGLDPAWVRTPDRVPGQSAPWLTMGEWLRERLPERVDVAALFVERRFVDEAGRAVEAAQPYRANTFVWFHRDLRDEPTVPGSIDILHRDERLVVVDKPAFLATIPRGRHVAQSVVVRLRHELNLPFLTPAHRLDRVTSGVLVLVTEPQWRGAYQQLFARREVTKRYLALVDYRTPMTLPTTVRNHLRKERGELRGEVVPGVGVNAVTDIELQRVLGDRAVLSLRPQTGRTHQLRMHLSGLGMGIVGDPLYPEVVDVAIDDFSTPLQLLAESIRFVDPVDRSMRAFSSQRSLPLPAPI